MCLSMTIIRALGIILVSLLTAAHFYRPIHLVRVGGIASTLYWTARSWLSKYPVTPDYTMWDEGDINEYEKWKIQRKRVLRIWHFLRPFFSSYGYDLYYLVEEPNSYNLFPQQNRVFPIKDGHYPYAKSILLDDKEAKFGFSVSNIPHCATKYISFVVSCCLGCPR